MLATKFQKSLLNFGHWFSRILKWGASSRWLATLYCPMLHGPCRIRSKWPIREDVSRFKILGKVTKIKMPQKSLMSLINNPFRHYCPTEKKFPESFASLYGPLRAPYVNTGQVNSSGGKEFPENVVFIQGNYVFSCDEFLDRQEPEYDTIIGNDEILL